MYTKRMVRDAYDFLKSRNYVITEKSKYDGIKDSRPEFVKNLNDIIATGSTEEAAEAQALINQIEEGFTEATMEEMEMVKSYKAHYADREKGLKPSLDDIPKKLVEKFGILTDTFMTVKSAERKLGVLLTRVDKVTSQDDVRDEIIKILTDPKMDKTDGVLGECASAFNTFFGSIAEKLIDAGYIKSRIGDNKTTWRAAYYEQDDKGAMKKFIGKNKWEDDKADQIAKGLETRRANKAKAMASESFYARNGEMLNEGIKDFLGGIANKVSSFFKGLCSKLFSKEADDKIDDLTDALKNRALLLRKTYAEIYSMVDNID